MRTPLLLTLLAVSTFTSAQTVDEHYQAAINFYQNGYHTSALDRLNYAIAEEAESPELYYWRALCYYKLDDVKLALSDLDRALKIESFADAHFLRGALHLQENRTSAAIRDLEKAKELKTLFEEVYYYLGYAYFLDEEYQFALTYLDMYERVGKKKHYQLYYYKGLSEGKLHQQGKAMRSLKKAAKMKARELELASPADSDSGFMLSGT